MRERRATLKLGYACNNNCIFCRVGRRGCKDKTTEKIKEELKKLRGLGISSILITGGEPTIRSDIFEIIHYAKRVGFKNIHLESNGRMFYYKKFIERAIIAGVSSFAVALHSHRAEVHDFLTRVPGSFEETVRGIENLMEYRVSVINNTTVTKFNYKELPELLKFLDNYGIKCCMFSFVQPVGRVHENYEEIVPKISEVAQYFHEILDIARKKNIQMIIEGLTPCFMQGYEKYITELRAPRDLVVAPDYSVSDFHEFRIKTGRLKAPQCKDCKYTLICIGTWKDYVKKEGYGEFKPVAGDTLKYKTNSFFGLPERYIPDFILVKSGFKPLMRLFIYPNEYKKLEAFIKGQSLFIAHSDYKVPPEFWAAEEALPLDSKEGMIYAYVSKSEELLEKAKVYEGYDFNTHNHKKFGRLLGYPSCCIDFFLKNNKRPHPEFVNRAIEKSNKFSFYLNNLLWGTPYHIISHFPCSYDCKESIEYAKKAFKIIRKEEPLFGSELECYLKLPVLYLDLNKWLIFHGDVEDRKIVYDNVFSVDKNLEKKFKGRNEIRTATNSVQIFKNGKLIDEILERGKIIKFS
jgi:cyclic pyranopterin phosphate synthase